MKTIGTKVKYYSKKYLFCVTNFKSKDKKKESDAR